MVIEAAAEMLPRGRVPVIIYTDGLHMPLPSVPEGGYGNDDAGGDTVGFDAKAIAVKAVKNGPNATVRGRWVYETRRRKAGAEWMQLKSLQAAMMRYEEDCPCTCRHPSIQGHGEVGYSIFQWH
jgi:hypothetical protein